MFDGELLVLSSITIPDDKGSLVFSFLAEIDDTTAFDVPEGVVGLGVFAILIFGSIEEVKHASFSKDILKVGSNYLYIV